VLDVVARQEPDVVGAFLDVAATTRELQDAATEGRRAGSLPAALRDLRAGQAEVAARANAVLTRSGRPADLGAIMARLGQVGADAATGALLREAVLGVDIGEIAGWFVDATPESASRPDEATEHVNTGETVDETERRRAQDAIGRELKAATREAQVLATAARRARDRRDRAATAVVAAEETVLAAELAVDAARSELVRLDTELDDAETKAGAAQQLAAELADRLAE